MISRPLALPFPPTVVEWELTFRFAIAMVSLPWMWQLKNANATLGIKAVRPRDAVLVDNLVTSHTLETHSVTHVPLGHKRTQRVPLALTLVIAGTMLRWSL